MLRLGAWFAMPELRYKAYVRHAADGALIAQELRAAFGTEPQTLYLRADLCRRDLLVEIEAAGCYFPNARA